MAKESILVLVNGQQGRISNLRKEKGRVIGDLTENGNRDSRIVSLSQVKPGNKKAEKNLTDALHKIGVDYQTQHPGEKTSPRPMYA